MKLIVQKFGGSSVRDAQRLRNVAAIIADTRQRGDRVIVVLSAQGDTTDELLRKAHELSETPSPRELDALLATGEQVSVALCAILLEEMGIPAVSLNAWQAGIHTGDGHGDARITEIERQRVLQELEDGKIVLVAGFQGIDRAHDITTLGRGGSDTSAVALAAVFGADRCEIYIDVDGVYTADPRIVPTAVKHEKIDCEEMLALALHGAQVLHSRSVELARDYRVNVDVLSSIVRGKGTHIAVDSAVPSPHLAGVTRHEDRVTVVGTGLMQMPCAAARLYQVLNDEHIVVREIAQSDRCICARVAESDALTALHLAHRIFFEMPQE
ncbi:MAG: aspartate kinase [Oscillospiraceae bacterium]|nr:aspartate kinase [Oscillospiraceae bacterium]